jgi:lipopolysaccharide transport system ATP-binding protein
MSSDSAAIRVSKLSKCYHIYDRPPDRLKQFVLPRLMRLIGRPSRPYYHEFWALKESSFEVRRGETVGVVGRNGSGKSTLLQLICGTTYPTGGSVETNGRVAALLELGSGFNPEFTGRENVYMNGSVLGLTKSEIDDRFEDIAAFADIGEFIEHPIKTYSTGMYTRLAFAVIAHVKAEILVIDEALSVGDAFFVQKCMRFLRKFQETGTVLFVSHDTGAVTSLCDRAVWLDRGEVQADGSAKEVCEAYFEARYAEQTGVTQSVATKPAKKAVTVQPKARQEEKSKSIPKAQTIETFGFNYDSGEFGTGDATIYAVELLDKAGTPLNWIQGGEEAQVVVRATCNKDLEGPILGFHVKDRLGQPLFGDNTFLAYESKPVRARAGDRLEARFSFCLPLLLSGEYSICAAIASGTMQSHVQHHWLHDALIFSVHSSSLNGVLVGIPMESVTLVCNVGSPSLVGND